MMLRYIAIFSILHAQDIPLTQDLSTEGFTVLKSKKSVSFSQVVNRVSISEKTDGTSSFTMTQERLAPVHKVLENTITSDKMKIKEFLFFLILTVVEDSLKLTAKTRGCTWYVLDIEQDPLRIAALYSQLENVYLAYKSYSGITKSISKCTELMIEHSVFSQINDKKSKDKLIAIKAVLGTQAHRIGDFIAELKVEQLEKEAIYLETLKAYNDLLFSYNIPQSLKDQEPEPSNADQLDGYEEICLL